MLMRDAGTIVCLCVLVDQCRLEYDYINDSVSCKYCIGCYHHHQSELVGDVAVPVSARQAVLF